MDYTQQLQRLEKGILIARDRGDTEMARKLGTEYRRLQQAMAEQPQQSQQPQQPQQPQDATFGQKVEAAIDGPVESVADTAEVLGAEGTAGWLRGLTERPEGYQTYTERFMTPGEAGYDLNAAPGAILEQAPQFGATLAGAAAGARIGGLVGPWGALAGGLIGGAVPEVLQTFGPTAKERAANDGREEVSSGDMAAAALTAGASGAVNAITPGVTGIGRRMAVEGAAEGVQSGVQQVGATAGTESGLNVDLDQVGGEAILGAGSAGVVDGTIQGTRAAGRAVQDTADSVRYDSRPFSDDERRAAERIVRAANGDMSVLGNVDTDGEGSAKGAAYAALTEARAELSTVAERLRSLAKYQENDKAKTALKTLIREASNQKIPSPETHISAISEAMPGEPDTLRVASLLRQINAIQQFTEGSTGDMGGLSRITRRFDITDKRSESSFGAYALAGGGMAAGGPFGAAATMASQAGLNRAARMIDRLTNNRSRVKRFVESARRSGEAPKEIEGLRADERLNQLKQMAVAQKAADNFNLDQARQREQGGTGALNQSKASQRQAQLEAQRQAEAERQAFRYRTNAVATAPVFETGQIPENDPFFNTYRFMREQTGLNPEDALAVIEQLEREGVVEPGTAQRFVEDPLSFQKEESVPLQRAVRARANPDYVPPSPDRDDNTKAEQALKRFNTSRIQNARDRYEFKRLRGQEISANLDADILNAQGELTPDQFQALLDLKESIDTPNMTRAQRFSLVNDMLPLIFPKRNQRGMVEFWRKKFAPMAAIGNDYAIERQIEQDPEQAEKEKEFEKKVKEAKKPARRKKRSEQKPAEEAPEPAQPEPATDPTERKADAAVQKLKRKRKGDDPEPEASVGPDPKDPEPQSDAVKAREAKEPKPAEVTRKGPGKRLPMDQRVKDRIAQIEHSVFVATNYSDTLQSRMDNLPDHAEGRVERLIYEFASDQVTMNMLTDAYASRYGMDPRSAAQVVNSALAAMEGKGWLKRIVPKWADRLKHDGKVQYGEDGRPLRVVQLKFHDFSSDKDDGLDPEFSIRVEIAKAVSQVGKMVDQKGPNVLFDPDMLSDGDFEALKDIDPSRVDGTFYPILDFLNSLRQSKLRVHPAMLDQIETALPGVSDSQQGTINDVLTPELPNSKRRDDAPMRTVAQLLFTFGDKDSRTDTTLRQEWMAGANLRVYSRNGMAHSQAGDIMKGLLRMPEKHPVGGEEGLKWIFHGIGNLLGYDKKAPEFRRNVIFDEGLVDSLYKFAEKPFGRTTLRNSTKGRPLTKIGKIVNDSEGFFQALNAAHEIKSMVDFAKERFPEKAKQSPQRILSDPEVQKDLAQNYKTDFIVQLDASNNAYQVAGMVMGYEDVLKATGMLPRDGMEGDPDQIEGADIYLEPAKSIASRIPELVELDLPDSKLRKLFKKPIGTYLYASEYNSRKDAFRAELEKMADGAEIFGIGDEKALIRIPDETVQMMNSEEGAFFTRTKYGFKKGEHTEAEETVRRRVVEQDGKFYVQTASGKGKFNSGGAPYDSRESAIKAAYESDLYTRMSRELVRDLNLRYPGIVSYLKFAGTVARIVKDRGQEKVKVPTKDGMMLEYSFRQDPTFVGEEVDIGSGDPIPLGIRTPDYKVAGQGLAAFMTHQNDAWALRETFRRLVEQSPLKGFNPIHDSFGFHPSDASRGQQAWVEVMQELGDQDYNLFLDILKANNISPEEFVAAGGDLGFVQGRKGVRRVDARQIPTALS